MKGEINLEDFAHSWKSMLMMAQRMMETGGSALAVLIIHPNGDENWLTGDAANFCKLIGRMEFMKSQMLGIMEQQARQSNLQALVERAAKPAPPPRAPGDC